MSSEQEKAESIKRIGFAGMDQEARRLMAQRGGKAAHQSGKAHRFNSQEAIEAGKKSGQSRSKKRNTGVDA